MQSVGVIVRLAIKSLFFFYLALFYIWCALLLRLSVSPSLHRRVSFRLLCPAPFTPFSLCPLSRLRLSTYHARTFERSRGYWHVFLLISGVYLVPQARFFLSFVCVFVCRL